MAARPPTSRSPSRCDAACSPWQARLGSAAARQPRLCRCWHERNPGTLGNRERRQSRPDAWRVPWHRRRHPPGRKVAYVPLWRGQAPLRCLTLTLTLTLTRHRYEAKILDSDGPNRFDLVPTDNPLERKWELQAATALGLGLLPSHPFPCVLTVQCTMQ